MKVNVIKLNENAIIPKFEYEGDTGFSLYTCEDIVIKANKVAALPTGLAFEFPYGYAFQIKNRSGITMYGVPTLSGELARITVYEGTIDNNYRGQVSVMIKNEEGHKITIPKGTKIAQGVIIKVYQCEFNEVNKLSETERGENGFGSTGTK